MTASNVAPVFGERPASSGAPTGLWFAAICYALIALSPAPFYLYLRASSGLPADRWAGTTPFDAYFGVGLLYFGGAAVCSYLLFKRRAAAVWPAALVAAWKALEGVAALRRALLGVAEWSTLDIVGPFLVFGLFALLALFVRRLKRQGVLQ